ncbi:MAG: hypothetical protein ACM3ZQ_02585 [Bacillota bacterium]
MWETKDRTDEIQSPSEGSDRFPESHLAGLENPEELGTEEIAKHVYSNEMLFGMGLQKEWSRLAGEATPEKFVRAYGDYVDDPFTFYRQAPDQYQFMKEHLFYGQEYLKSAEAEQLSEATAALEQMQEIRPDVWEDLTLRERLDALQNVENLMSEIQGRTPIGVVTEPMEPGLYGYFDGKAVHISLEGLASNDVAEAVDTIIHEGRHAYQHYAVDHPGFHPDQEQVEAWRDNFKDYLTAELYGQEAYQTQPVEADAWAYASTIRHDIYGKGV